MAEESAKRGKVIARQEGMLDMLREQRNRAEAKIMELEASIT